MSTHTLQRGTEGGVCEAGSSPPFLLILPRPAVHYERSLMSSGPVSPDTSLLRSLAAKLLTPRKLQLFTAR